MWSDTRLRLRECWDSSTFTGGSWFDTEEGKYNCWIVSEFRDCSNWIDWFAFKEPGTKWTLRRKNQVKWVSHAGTRREGKRVGDWSWCLEKNTAKTWSRKR